LSTPTFDLPPSTIFLALGANLGDRLASLRAARLALGPEVIIVAQSPIYETPPWGYTDQPVFLNQVLRAETSLSPQALLAYLKRLEASLGRTPTLRYGSRQIDLDILFYADHILETPDLTIPHPRLHERAFVLVPLADLAPDWQHPTLGQTVRELLAQVSTAGIEWFAGDVP
jgi:2-amino-4-hydroxy-6-hydroxymethyldihydropteridine diphosphokinase